MFETLFTDVLNPEHELLRAGRLIDWDELIIPPFGSRCSVTSNYESTILFHPPLG
jgi:hypothetical protein